MSSDDDNKPRSFREEKRDPPPYDSNGSDAMFDGVEEKRLVRKIDWRLLPILGALYSIALIDRTNVSRENNLPRVFELSISLSWILLEL